VLAEEGKSGSIFPQRSAKPCRSTDQWLSLQPPASFNYSVAIAIALISSDLLHFYLTLELARNDGIG
jgi:hypothetical protein